MTARFTVRPNYEREALIGRTWDVWDRRTNTAVANHDSRTLARADARQMESGARVLSAERRSRRRGRVMLSRGPGGGLKITVRDVDVILFPARYFWKLGFSETATHRGWFRRFGLGPLLIVAWGPR